MTLTLAGVDGLTTFISVEPYSRTRAAPETPRNVDNGAGGSGRELLRDMAARGVEVITPY